MILRPLTPTRFANIFMGPTDADVASLSDLFGSQTVSGKLIAAAAAAAARRHPFVDVSFDSSRVNKV